jgi:hypothetical protein
MKNRWDALKGDYTIWKTLLLHASRLGRDLKTGSISASNEWCEEKIAACTIWKTLLLHASVAYTIVPSNG